MPAVQMLLMDRME